MVQLRTEKISRAERMIIYKWEHLIYKYLLAGFDALATFSWSVKEYYDPDKDQYKKRFQNKDR